MKRSLVDLDGDGAINDTTLTEAEFRAFLERFESFSRLLTPNERLFLLSILARATAAPWHDPQWSGLRPESAIRADLTYALWQSTHSRTPPISLNPQPIPRDLPDRATYDTTQYHEGEQDNAR